LRFPLGDKGALMLVCDGMGGAAAGEVASQMAVDSIFDDLAQAAPQDRNGFARTLRRAVEGANEKIFIQSRDNQSERGMGTTCTVAALVDGKLIIGQIGDSRCYVLRAGRLAQVTKDQSLAWQLIEAGAMTTEEAKAFEHANIILQALGVQEQVEVVLSEVDLRQGDIILLSSDGLHGPVADEEILEMLTAEPDLQKAGQTLIQKALDRDGPDNVTVVLARVVGDGLPPPAPEDTVAFVGYDPGPDPMLETSTGEVENLATTAAVPTTRIPKELVTPDDVVTKTDVSEEAGDAGVPASNIRPGRSLLALFLLALMAAAVGGISVMKCEREQAVQSEGRGSAP
ncbi:MAG TPA: protein phosphatase 2C domain-containing protein, partial [Polyangia bacterium]|nr:protein phosphatase 2C domain-containing protein [Polyangia bacterium]